MSSDSGDSQHTRIGYIARSRKLEKCGQRALSCEPDNRGASCRREVRSLGAGNGGRNAGIR
jgi:hypothetical protein